MKRDYLPPGLKPGEKRTRYRGFNVPVNITPEGKARIDARFKCNGCGRPEAECSAAPCPGVLADRGEVAQ